MKQITKISVIILFALLFLSGKHYAQEWSAEQKEVWAGVQKYWEINNSDPLAYYKYFDDSYFGWSYQNEAPGIKADAMKSSKYFTTKEKQKFNITTVKLQHLLDRKLVENKRWFYDILEVKEGEKPWKKEME